MSAKRGRRIVSALLAALAPGCVESPARPGVTDASREMDIPARDVVPFRDRTDETVTIDHTDVLGDENAPADDRSPGAIELGTGQDGFEDLPRSGGRVELVHGPQGGWHVYGRVRLRGVAPDVYLTFSLVPEAGGAPVNLANETVRRQERRGLTLVGDAYESSYGELVILADGVRPPDVVGRRFRFGVRVERPDAIMTRAPVGADERVVTVIDEVP